MRRALPNAPRFAPRCVLALVVLLSLLGVMLLGKLVDLQEEIRLVRQEGAKLQQQLDEALHECVKQLSQAQIVSSLPPTQHILAHDLKPLRAKLATFLLPPSSAYPRPMCDTERLYDKFNVFSTASSKLTCKVKGRLDYARGTGLHCWGKNLLLNPKLIQVSRGGEDVLTVMGRAENAENAVIQPGAFAAATREEYVCDMDTFRRLDVFIKPCKWAHQMLQSICRATMTTTTTTGAIATSACIKFDPTPILLVHRYEYVNLYHTATELLSALVSYRSALLDSGQLLSENEPVRVLFLDGHAAGNLDEVWSWVFSQNRLETWRVGQLEEVQCFARVIIAELGYAADINLHPGDAQVFNADQTLPANTMNRAEWCVMEETQMLGKLMRQYADVGKGGKEHDKRAKRRVLFIARDGLDKPAHPRVAPGRGISRSTLGIADLEAKALALSERNDLDVQVVRLSNMPLPEQIALLCSADVVIAVHGAALMHLVWATQALFIELSPTHYLPRMHFPKAAARAGTRFARLTGRDGRFLHSSMGGEEGAGFTFTPDMLEAVIGWSLLPTPEEQLANV